MNIHEETLKIARNLIEKDPSLTDWVISKFPELKESEDERVWRELIEGFKRYDDGALFNGCLVREIIAWLEKQGEHANFRNKIQIGDKVTRNEDGVLVNLSQLKRVAKKDEKQGEKKPADKQFTPEQAGVLDKHIDKFLEQKPTDKVYTKFKVGDEIKTTNEEPLTITKIDEKGYWSEDLLVCDFADAAKW